MKFELDLIRASAAAPALTHEDLDPLPAVRMPTEPSRKAIRLATDAAIHDALRRDSMIALAESLAQTMLAVASALETYKVEPGVEDLVEGSSALIEDARTIIDKGLVLRDWALVNCGAVMLEIVCRGVCSCLGIPYEDTVRAVHAGTGLREVLIKAGKLKDESNVDGEKSAPADGHRGDAGDTGGRAGD